MAPSPQHSARKLSHKPSLFPATDPRFTPHASRLTVPLIGVLLALLCLVGTACGTIAPTGKIIFDDPRGTVSLQTISDQSIQANHPISLDPALLAKILRGIEIQDQERSLQNHVLQKMIEGPSSPVPVFSDDQIRFLAPLLAEGLRTAAPDQRIEYRVQTTRKGSVFQSSTTETTAGSLYAYGRQLYVTLSQYRYDPIRTYMVNSTSAVQTRQADASGLKNRTLLFTPSAAQRSDSFDPPTGGAYTDRFLAIDYQLLQETSPAVATTEHTAPQVERAAPVRESLAGTGASDAPSPTTEALAQEVETLRKALQSVQQQLDSQTTRPDSQKRKTTPPSKPQQTAP
jgi:hypothetical protein